MQSFGLEESGHYDAAEAAGHAALEVNPDDVWATHAVAHVLEMQGRVDEGIRFMRTTEGDWGDGNLFTVHLWWHLALYHLEAARHDVVLDIYDTQIHHAESDGVPLEMLDASALLWRLLLDDVDTGGRFEPLADAWSGQDELQPWYVFNDLHAVMAHAGAGRLDQARTHVERLEGWLAEATDGTNRRMTAEIGLPTCRAAVAFVEDRHDDVLTELLPIRQVFQHFGGSHAQRDVLQRTVVESALHSGRHDLARALLAERLSLRDTSVYGWSRLARLAAAEGDEDGAAAARDRADGYQALFAAAT
jgi:hypothetical protein